MEDKRIAINLTEKEAKYLISLLKNETRQSQAVMRKNQELKGFFTENNLLNGTIGRKITNSFKSTKQ